MGCARRRMILNLYFFIFLERKQSYEPVRLREACDAETLRLSKPVGDGTGANILSSSL